MADVFISYTSRRRAAAKHLARVLELHGFSVWFDYRLYSGKDFGPQIERQLKDAKATVVLWCPLSCESEWVREEADLAKTLGTLVPAWLERVELPLGYRRIETVDLTNWVGSPRGGGGLDRLLDEIARMVGRDPQLTAFRALREYEDIWRDFGAMSLSQFPLTPPSEEQEQSRGFAAEAETRRLEKERRAKEELEAHRRREEAEASQKQHTEFDQAMAAGTVGALDGFVAKHSQSPLAKTAKREREKILRQASPGPLAKTKPVPVPVTECDCLAASPHDADRVAGVDGVVSEKIDTVRAVMACAEAVREFPHERRFVYQYGRALHAAGQYDEAREQYGAAASAGSAAAVNGLGWMFANGFGVAKDEAEAVRFYREAAEAGNAAAMLNLGLMHENGRGVTKDLAKAREYYRRAADCGDEKAKGALKRLSKAK
jgi:tetratricopeptide (TPR) repeat protein